MQSKYGATFSKPLHNFQEEKYLCAMQKLLWKIYNFYESLIIACRGVQQFGRSLQLASRDEHTLTSDFRSVLIMK